MPFHSLFLPFSFPFFLLIQLSDQNPSFYVEYTGKLQSLLPEFQEIYKTFFRYTRLRHPKFRGLPLPPSAAWETLFTSNKMDLSCRVNVIILLTLCCIVTVEIFARALTLSLSRRAVKLDYLTDWL